MYNGPDSDPSHLPSSAALVKSTIIALLASGLVLVTVV